MNSLGEMTSLNEYLVALMITTKHIRPLY